jgi:hypothetical protein
LAKEKRICLFLGKPCKNCAIYIGRHYYLCRDTNGRRKAAKKTVAHGAFGLKAKKNFAIPIIKIRVLDPFDTGL